MIVIKDKKVYKVSGYIITMNGMPARIYYDELDRQGRIIFSKECVIWHESTYNQLRAAIKRQQRRFRRVAGIKDDHKYRIIRVIERIGMKLEDARQVKNVE